MSTFGRISRSIVLVALIIGSLFPTVGGIGITTIASPIALVVILYELGRWIPKIHPILFVPLFFGAVALHAMAVPAATAYGTQKYGMWFTSTLITAVAASLLRDERSLFTFARTWLIASGVLAVATIAGFSGGDGRADGFDSNPIWLGRAMATGIVMALFLVMQKDIRLWLFLAVSVLLGVGILATGSRGPTLAVGIGAVALVLFTRHHRIRRVVGIIIGAAAAYWAVSTLPFFAGSRIITLLSEGATDQFRTLFWSQTLPLLSEYPGGIGIGNWPLYAGAPKQFFYPHSLYLEVFAEFGIGFGVVLVAITLIILIRLLMRSRETPVAILIFALLATEIAQVSVSGDLNARTFWFLLTLGFLVAVRAVIPSTPAKPEQHTVAVPLRSTVRR